ncbi:MAG TPA: molybdopterin cofactor-binding domain-containing protein [Burkholderiaceae bacterium]|nr:molybdopterin cofactor-binding domain-containing protein [Burkholderiaceae bacterium]
MRRRSLLLSGAAVGGAVLVGWSVLPPRSRLGNAALWPPVKDEVALNGWIKIANDGAAVLAMNRSEMGQGVHTALAMLAAEELDVPLERVRLQQAGHDAIFGSAESFVGFLPFQVDDREPGQESLAFRGARWMTLKLARELGINITGGSASVADAWEPLRLAAATARARLLGVASLRWKLPVAELEVRDGVVSHASGPRAHYGELAEQAALSPPGDVTLKPPQAWRVIGHPVQRLDLVPKCDGRAVFGLDVRLPGLVFADVLHAPMLGGSPATVDVDAVLARPGVERVVRLPPLGGAPAAIAVIARTTWHARTAARALSVQWREPPSGLLDSKRIEAALEAAARDAAEHQRGFGFHSRGDVRAALAGAARRIEALYRAPYLAHATMEPMNCTARVQDGRVEVWAPTQVPGLARDAAARVAGVEPDAVTVHVTYLGGGFGRRLEVDFVAQAVRVALETAGRPVQLAWSREEDFMHDYYRPAGVALLRAGLDAARRVTAFEARSAGDALEPRWVERALPALAGPVDAPDKTTVEGLYDLPYAIEHQRIAHVATFSGVPIGNWRSVGHSHNAFFAESFVDELAHAAGADPLKFRLALLGDKPRHAAVLNLAAQKAGWGRPLPAGRARGLALHESFGTIVAQVVELSLTAGKRPRVHRVVCALDCGVVVHPQGVAQQVESSVVFGLSAALYGRIDIEAGVVKQRNFPDYLLLTMAQTPLIETHTLPSSRPPTGMGEPALPPVAPALANALFALTGRRLRELPLAPLLGA